ncbi:DBF4-type zinc finger-containing protein 2 isoform X2 [Mastacembelus armatus]|uniref:DBF4-type zinc finger-containing protein 2 isoform X2 n=1 Tax=Mastacembelus armatus TaxID=205130 RepID=UPI000E455067|nr:DBF4-type zinc finger-containing protein 2 isoform X2 [Mastacembelus armatus]
MSDSSDEDDQGKVQSTSRMWEDSQPGPSRCQPSRQGYCGYCRVLYSNLDQHLSSLRHLDSVQASSRSSSLVSSTSCSRAKLTLLERFLQDVHQHHPHSYSDPRPSHADLPSVSAPPLPRAELDEIRFSDEDSRSLGTREHLPSSDASSCQPANHQGDNNNRSHSGERITEEASHSQERLSAPIREQEEGRAAPTEPTYSPQAQALPPQTTATPPIHRKAHRKTNRRKTSDSSSPPPLRGTGPGPSPDRPSELRPWLRWQKERREAQKEEAFSSDHSDPVEQTIEEVIQLCCYGVSSTPCQQEEAESFHYSLPVSMETQSDDWDSPVQLVLRGAQTLSDTKPPHTPVQVGQTEGRDLSSLMDVQVDLEDQVYSYQLDSILHNDQTEGGRDKTDQGFWTLPIEEVLPVPSHIPESFRGKSWAQIEKEDEDRVEKLVRQFRRGRYICYFDSESLARYGRRSQNKKGCDEKKAGSDTGVLPLLERDADDSVYVRRKRRSFRVASRCQVVKVSHGTQTVRVVVPAVRQQAPEAMPISIPTANQETAEKTPEVQMWRSLPPSYSSIITPVQPRTTVVYLLCSPLGPSPTCPLAAGSASKRCRKKRRPLDLQGLKVKYKRLPVRFYDPGTNRILRTPPKSLLWRRGPTHSGPPPPCVRQLFRSLSPDLNTDRPPGEGSTSSSRVKGQKAADPPFSFLLSTLSRDSAQTDKPDTIRRRGRTVKAPPPAPHSRSERGRGARREKTRPPLSTRRTRTQATPPQPRREGLRRAAPSNLPHPPSLRRGRARRGRGCERVRR